MTVEQAASGQRLDRGTMTLALGLLGTALVDVVLYPVALALREQGHDFLLLYAAAHALRDGYNPYDTAVFLRYVLAAGVNPVFLLDSAQRLSQPYVYPPLFAWLIAPFTYLKPPTALVVWRLVSVGTVFAGTLAMAALWVRPPEAPSGVPSLAATPARRLLLTALVTAAPLTLYCLYWGNPVVVVYAAMGLWLWALWRDSPRLDRLAGALMTAALLKPQLALPLAACAALCLTQGPDAWLRRRRIASSFAVTFAGLLALDVLVTGPALLLAWPRAVLYLSHLPDVQGDSPSLFAVFLGAAHGLPGWVSALAAVALALLGLTALAWAYRTLHERWAPVRLLALLTAIWCLATPYSHANDEILLVPAAFELLAWLSRGPSARAAVDRSLHRAIALRARRAVASAAVAGLWLGGLLWILGTLIRFHWNMGAGPENLNALAPLLLLVALSLVRTPTALAPRVATMAHLTDFQHVPPADATAQLE